MMATPAEMPAQVPSYWMPYFQVADASKVVTDAAAVGANVMVPVSPIPGGTMSFAILGHPQGATLALAEHRALTVASPQRSVITRLAVRRSPVPVTRAGAAARRAAVVRLPHAAAQRQLRPVVRVQRLLDVVRAAEHGRDGADLVDPLGLVHRARRCPGRQALLLEQPDGVLAQPAAVEGRRRGRAS